MPPLAPRRRRPSARGKKSRAVDRRADPLARVAARVDRWFDRHPIAGASVTVVTLAAFLYLVYAVALATGVYRRYIARHTEPLLATRVVPAWTAWTARVERATRRVRGDA